MDTYFSVSNGSKEGMVYGVWMMALILIQLPTNQPTRVNLVKWITSITIEITKQAIKSCSVIMKICEYIFFPQVLLKDAQMQFTQTDGRCSPYNSISHPTNSEDSFMNFCLCKFYVYCCKYERSFTIYKIFMILLNLFFVSSLFKLKTMVFNSFKTFSGYWKRTLLCIQVVFNWMKKDRLFDFQSFKFRWIWI